MQAKDVMTKNVITVLPRTEVRAVAETLLKHRISAVPVTDEQGRLLGIISEGDLVRRKETGTARPSSWWLAFLTSPGTQTHDFVKSHGQLAGDVMTANVVSISENHPIGEIASVLEKNRIKRVPVVRDRKVVGIVSRADLVRALASIPPPPALAVSDATLREAVEKAIRDRAGLVPYMSFTVTGGTVRLWGGVEEAWAKDAARVAAENVPGVRAVEDNVRILPPEMTALIGTQ
jgi:CBS domain-containing protein